MRETNCRFCDASVSTVFVDLGMSPLANSFLSPDKLRQMEPFYPLRALVCESCFLVQLEEYETPQAIFSQYAYFSSYSTTWLDHSEQFAAMATQRFGLDGDSNVVELASNDGYLLKYFARAGIPVLGIEPAANVAAVAQEQGIRTIVKFFGRATAREIASMMRADLLVANNVIAHVPDLNDFVAGMKIILAKDGVVSIEFPHLMRLIEENEFDTIYHEHFSYFSFLTLQRVFAAHGLTVFDVEELSTHGGSLRVFAAHSEDETKVISERSEELSRRERSAGFEQIGTYRNFTERARQAKWELLELLVAEKRKGKRIVAYGAPAKGNTLLNYCGIDSDLIDFTADRNPHKQGHYLPGTHIPIKDPDAIRDAMPDIVFILPWNLTHEIIDQLAYVREWGGRFLVRTPKLELLA